MIFPAFSYLINYLCFSLLFQSCIENFNPKLGLLIGLVENILIFSYFITKNLTVALKYLVIMIIYKIIPIYLLNKYPIHFPNDVYLFLIICILFKFYMYYRGHPSIYSVYKQSYIDILNGKNNTPMFALFAYLESCFFF